MTDQAKPKEKLQFQQVMKRFKDGHQIGEMTFSVYRGEVFALCGGNGAGKSTIIQLLTGQMKVSGGQILIDGERIDRKSQAFKNSFAFMPDSMAFPKVLTGFEVLLFFAELRKMPDPKSRVEELLKKVGLWDVRHKKVRTFSKGMQQRLSLAQALLSDAALFILDEPTNGLDPYWVKRFKEILIEERRKGRTILFTTHILADVEEIADSVAFMNEGKLLVTGKTEAIRQLYGENLRLEDVFFSLIHEYE